MLRDASCMDLEDLHPPLFIRQWDLDLPVQPPRTKECGIQNIRPVGCHDHFHLYKQDKSVFVRHYASRQTALKILGQVVRDNQHHLNKVYSFLHQNCNSGTITVLARRTTLQMTDYVAVFCDYCMRAEGLIRTKNNNSLLTNCELFFASCKCNMNLQHLMNEFRRKKNFHVTMYRFQEMNSRQLI